jgi:hypothetical protein
VNHLTRMQPGYICVAGIERETGQHIRPVLRGRLTRDLLAGNGGPFDIGSVVDLGDVQNAGSPPEVEDRIFDPNASHEIAVTKAAAFWRLLQDVLQTKLEAIFGKDLTPRSSGCTVDLNRGHASLGCLRPAAPPTIYVNPYNQLRITVTDGTHTLDLSLTDLRLYEKDQRAPLSQLIRTVNQRIRKGAGVILSVGLARAFQARNDSERRHWLQVNNIHLEDAPVWRLGT